MSNIICRFHPYKSCVPADSAVDNETYKIIRFKQTDNVYEKTMVRIVI